LYWQKPSAPVGGASLDIDQSEELKEDYIESIINIKI